MAPAGAYTVIALVPPMREQDPQPGGNAPFGFDTPSVEAAVAELSSRGVEFEDVRSGEGPVPPMAYFRDPDGNRGRTHPVRPERGQLPTAVAPARALAPRPAVRRSAPCVRIGPR